MFGRNKRIRVLIGGPARRRDTLVRHLLTVGVAANPASRRLRTALRQVLSTDIVQRTIFIDCDYRKTVKVFAWAKLLGKHTVRYWVGSDVHLVLSNSRIHRMAKTLDFLTDANLVVAPHLASELNEVGIRTLCNYAPQDNVVPENVPGFPERFTVLFYSSADRRGFYNLPTLFEIAGRLPNATFEVVGDSGAGLTPPPNVRFRGFVEDMDSAYATSSVLLRLVPHDGLPRMIVEALARGRPVVYNHEFPHCVFVKDSDDTVAALTSLAKNLKTNEAGKEFVRANYSDNRHALQMKRFYERLCGRRR